MNYLKLNIGGKERGAKLGLGFLTKIQEVTNMNLDEINKSIVEDSLKVAPKLIYESLLFNCERSKEEPDFDFYDVCDWLSEDAITSENGNIMIFIKAYFESIKVLFPQSETVQEEGKKQLPKKGSTPTSGSKK